MLWVVLWSACSGTGEKLPPPADDSDTVVVDTPPPVETDSAPEAPPDTETPEVSEPPALPLAPPPPASWGAGFSDETRALPLLDVLPVGIGSYAPPQPPEPGAGGIGDLDEDGHPELIVGNGRDEAGTRVDLRVYTWFGPGDLRRRMDLELSVGPREDRPWLVLDLDDDGHLDLLLSSGVPRIRWGAGDGTFPTETALDLGLSPEARVVFESGGSVADVDDDGWLDLLIGLTGCHYVVVPWLRTGPRSFERRDDLVTETTGAARTTAILPLVDTRGARSWVAVADSCDRSSPHPGFYRLERSDPFVLPQATAVDLAPPDVYWRLDPITGGGPMTLVAPMGALTTDWDMDGELDLALALGTRAFAMLAGEPTGGWSDRTPVARVGADPSVPGFPDEFAWAIGALDLDQDGWPDLVIAMGDDVTSLRLARGLVMQPQVWRNQGGWSFADITTDVGLAIDGGWHGLVLHDLDADGDADMLLGGYGVPPRLLHNRIRTDNHGLSLQLRGTTSNRYGVGAIVRAYPSGLPARTMLMGETGNLEGQPRPTLFFGVGANEVLERLEITWPSGFVQELHDLAAGQLHEVVEPPTLEVLSPLRHAPAGSVVELRVTPRHVDGSVNTAGMVDVHLSAGALRSAARQADGSWLVRIAGPQQPGTSVIEVSVDGAPLGVRPRLWWD